MNKRFFSALFSFIMEDKDKDIEELVIDTLLEQPVRFTLGGKSLSLYPASLGVSFLATRLVRQLQVNDALLQVEPYAECLRLATTQAEECAELIALHTCKGRREVTNVELRKRRKAHIAKQDAESIATLLDIVLKQDKTNVLIKGLGIDREQMRMQRALQAKDEDKNNFSFGGTSIYGSLIDTACERYKWTYDYVLWCISYTNLRLLLADSVKQVYLTDEERKRAHINNNVVVDADNKENMELILKQKWD